VLAWVFQDVPRLISGEPVDAERLAGVIKEYARLHGAPIVYGSKVLFVYIGGTGSVSVPGDWNDWDTSADRMLRVTSDLWVLLKEFPVDARLDYKLYVDGRWILDPLNNRTVLGGFGPNSELAMPSHVFPPWYSVAGLELKGRLTTLSLVNKYTGRVHSVTIYTPPGAGSYEYIVYFYDGGDYLNYCYAAKIIEYLVIEGVIPPVAAVFVSVSDPGNRIAEYGDLLDETSSFLVEQVIPLAEGVLNASSVKRVIVGDSLAGLAATYTLAKYPEVFHYALIQSPAYWYRYEQGKLVNALAQASLAGHRVYIHYGVFEGEEFTSIIENVAGILREREASVEVAKTNQGHSWGQWREYLGYGLIRLLTTA